MALVGPAPMLDSNPFAVMLQDLRDERFAGLAFPPGETRFSIPRTRRFANEPLEMLLENYERYGPVFTMRLFHSNVVFMLGPAANHHILVSHASNFAWRCGPLPRPDRADGRRPADDRRRLPSPLAHDHAAGVPPREHRRLRTTRSCPRRRARSTRLAPGSDLDLYAWTRKLAMRVAMRALFGLDPDGSRARAIDAAGLFEEALAFYASDYFLRVLRGRAARRGRACRTPRASSTR